MYRWLPMMVSTVRETPSLAPWCSTTTARGCCCRPMARASSSLPMRRLCCCMTRHSPMRATTLGLDHSPRQVRRHLRHVTVGDLVDQLPRLVPLGIANGGRCVPGQLQELLFGHIQHAGQPHIGDRRRATTAIEPRRYGVVADLHLLRHIPHAQPQLLHSAPDKGRPGFRLLTLPPLPPLWACHYSYLLWLDTPHRGVYIYYQW